MHRMVLLALCASFGLTGCAGLTDPYQREGTWNPEHVNDTNLAVMVDNPADLQRGRPLEISNGQTSAAAVSRFLNGKVKRLPESGVAELKPVDSGSGTSNGAITQ
jgi:hypothetical protein